MSQNRTFVCSLLLLLLLHSLHSALGLFEGCDYTYNLNPGTSYLESPYYPNKYPSGTSCRYQFIAPVDYTIDASCTVDIPSNNGTCTNEFLYISTQGDQQLRDSEQICGQGVLNRTALFRKMTFAYASYGSSGKFRCSLTVRQQPCECGWSVTSKIANGQEAGDKEFPFMAGLQNLDSSTLIFCGGTIISHFYVLTATHCAQQQPNATRIRVLVGFKYKSQVNSSRYSAAYAVQRMYSYPGYADNPPVNDLTILVTATSIEWELGVGPICLPPSTSSTFTYETVDVVGWGTTSFAGPTSDSMMKANLMVIDNSVCQKSYDVPIYSSQVCTNDYSGNGRDACQFDSGGPVVLRRSRMFLIGCISYGQACGQSYGTGVNTRITSFLNWVRQKTGYTTCVKPLG